MLGENSWIEAFNNLFISKPEEQGMSTEAIAGLAFTTVVAGAGAVLYMCRNKRTPIIHSQTSPVTLTISEAVRLNSMYDENCKTWDVGKYGMLNFEHLATIAMFIKSTTGNIPADSAQLRELYLYLSYLYRFDISSEMTVFLRLLNHHQNWLARDLCAFDTMMAMIKSESIPVNEGKLELESESAKKRKRRTFEDDERKRCTDMHEEIAKYWNAQELRAELIEEETLTVCRYVKRLTGKIPENHWHLLETIYHLNYLMRFTNDDYMTFLKRLENHDSWLAIKLKVFIEVLPTALSESNIYKNVEEQIPQEAGDETHTTSSTSDAQATQGATSSASDAQSSELAATSSTSDVEASALPATAPAVARHSGSSNLLSKLFNRKRMS